MEIFQHNNNNYSTNHSKTTESKVAKNEDHVVEEEKEELELWYLCELCYNQRAFSSIRCLVIHKINVHRVVYGENNVNKKGRELSLLQKNNLNTKKDTQRKLQKCSTLKIHKLKKNKIDKNVSVLPNSKFHAVIPESSPCEKTWGTKAKNKNDRFRKPKPFPKITSSLLKQILIKNFVAAVAKGQSCKDERSKMNLNIEILISDRIGSTNHDEAEVPSITI